MHEFVDETRRGAGIRHARRCARCSPRRATSRASSRRWTGRLSSRRSGTSTRRSSSTPERVAGGVAFCARNAAALERAEREYGVPAEVDRRDHRRRDVLRRELGLLSGVRCADHAGVRLSAPRRLLSRRAEAIPAAHARAGSLAAGPRRAPSPARWAFRSSCPAAIARYAVDFDGDGRVDLWAEHGRRDRQRRELSRPSRLAARPARAAACDDRRRRARRGAAQTRRRHQRAAHAGGVGRRRRRR